MLFGRRKPGFIETEEAQADADNDNNDLPAETVETEGAESELLEYLASLPDAEEDPFEGIPVKEAVMEAAVELTEAQKLADYIRLRTQAIQLTAKTSLENEIDNLAELLEEQKSDESCQDIVFVTGDKDIYYYSTEFMSDNYAMIAALVEEKDLPVTIAKMVRFNCKTYPAPTPLAYFTRSPYHATMPQMERAIAVLESKEDCRDIQVFTNNVGEQFFFSTEYMSFKYARALANVDEYTD